MMMNGYHRPIKSRSSGRETHRRVCLALNEADAFSARYGILCGTMALRVRGSMLIKRMLTAVVYHCRRYYRRRHASLC